MFDFSGIFGVERFKIWCQKVLPTVYDDSLSYMELLCKVLKVLEEYGKGSAEIAEQVVSIAERVAGLIDMVGGKTAYLGEYVNMEDVPADAVIVGGNGTEEEPYNAFEAGGSKEHGGWVRVGAEVVPESDFKKLEAVVHDITEEQARNLKTFAVGETVTVSGTTDQNSFISNEINLTDGMYIITVNLRSTRAGLAGEERTFTGLLNFLNKPTGVAAIGILFDPLLTSYFALYDLNRGTLSLEGIGNFFELTEDSVNITFYIRRIY